jgi:hypothetical protein
MTRLARWPAGFLVTQLIEVPVYLVACQHLPWPKRIGVAFGASLITHPFVWFLGPMLVPEPYPLRLALSEGFAILVEAGWLRAFGVRDALLWSIFANSLSVVGGHLLHALLGWP